MATVRQFEELKAWQEGREIAKMIYAVTRAGEFAKDFGLKDQIQRAVVSINSNIAEGFERDSSAEFVKFLGYAKGSAGEVRSQLTTAFDIGYLTCSEFKTLVERVKFVSALITRLRASVLKQDKPGLRWKSPETFQSCNLETLQP